MSIRKKHTSGIKSRQIWQCYLMLMPQILGFIFLSAYPICWAARLAWYYYDGSPINTRFIGWENFVNVFIKDSAYWKAWLTTIKFTVLKLPIELPLAMILALFVNKKLRGRGFFRAVYFLPHIISIAIVGLIISNMFDYFGVINAVLMKMNIISERIDWFSDKRLALMVLIIGNIWNTFGVNVLYFLAALQNIPEDVYESAKIDGAGTVTIFFRITLPLMAPVLQTILLLAVNGSLHTNDYILVTTNGAPGGETFTVMSYIVDKFVPGFAQSIVNIGYGCALSLVTSIFMGIIAVVYIKFSNRLTDIY